MQATSKNLGSRAFNYSGDLEDVSPATSNQIILVFRAEKDRRSRFGGGTNENHRQQTTLFISPPSTFPQVCRQRHSLHLGRWVVCFHLTSFDFMRSEFQQTVSDASFNCLASCYHRLCRRKPNLRHYPTIPYQYRGYQEPGAGRWSRA